MQNVFENMKNFSSYFLPLALAISDEQEFIAFLNALTVIELESVFKELFASYRLTNDRIMWCLRLLVAHGKEIQYKTAERENYKISFDLLALIIVDSELMEYLNSDISNIYVCCRDKFIYLAASKPGFLQSIDSSSRQRIIASVNAFLYNVNSVNLSDLSLHRRYISQSALDRLRILDDDI